MVIVIIIAVLIAVVIIASIVIAIYRNSLRKKSERLVDVINNITPYHINIASGLESIDLPQSPLARVTQKNIAICYNHTEYRGAPVY